MLRFDKVTFYYSSLNIFYLKDCESGVLLFSEFVRPLLLDSSLNIAEIPKIVMWDAGIIHYPLSIYLSLDIDKMYLLLM